MMDDNVELVRRGAEGFLAGKPDLDLYTDDFQLLNFPDAPWQPSPGKGGLQEWLDFIDDVADEWGADYELVEAFDSDHVLMVGKLWARFHTTGIRDETPFAQVVTVTAGKLSRVETHYTREQALEAAGLAG